MWVGVVGPRWFLRGTRPKEGYRNTPAVARLAGLGLSLYGWLSGNMPLFVVGLVVGFAGFVIEWTTPPKSAPLDMEAMTALSDEEFEQQLKDYEAGRRKTLPGQ